MREARCPGTERLADADRTARIAVALHPLWMASPVEGRQALDEVLTAKGVADNVRGRALWAAWTVAHAQGDLSSEKRFLEEARPLFARLGDRWSLADTLRRLAGVAISDGEFDRARELFSRANRSPTKSGIQGCLRPQQVLGLTFRSIRVTTSRRRLSSYKGCNALVRPRTRGW